MLTKDEYRNRLEEIFSKGFVVRLSNYRVASEWKSSIHGNVEMPFIEVVLMRNDSVKQLRDLFFAFGSNAEKWLWSYHRRKEYRIENGKKLGDLDGLCIPHEAGYLITLAEHPRTYTIDELLNHELKHVIEFEIHKMRKNGKIKTLIYNGKKVKKNEEFLIHQNIELRRMIFT